MWKILVSKAWQKIPRRARLQIIRATQKKFTVSVVAVITRAEDGRILLLDHFLRPGAGWALPGGFIEAGEQPEAAIRREIREETTLELENIKLARVRTIRRHIEIVFHAEARGEARPNSGEIKEARWFAHDEFPPEVAEAQKRIVEEALNQR
jgi:ADP-ribose pyrophosphatase YjhB (NUDIX family)